MIIYIDESGSINNHMTNNRYFIIALVRVISKDSLRKAYKRFVSSNFERLKELDQAKLHPQNHRVIKEGGKMFANDNFKELKGSQFDKDMKLRFVEFFSRKQYFEIYYIKIDNEKLTDRLCENKSRVFNYAIKCAMEYFIRNGYLPDENCYLQLDERNERAESRNFLENYLNTELSMNKTATGEFKAAYYDSIENNMIQIADVFANLYYSNTQTGGYDKEIRQLQDAGIIRAVYEFPK